MQVLFYREQIGIRKQHCSITIIGGEPERAQHKRSVHKFIICLSVCLLVHTFMNNSLQK